MAKFTVTEERMIEGNKVLLEAFGKSTDDKPSGNISTGSFAYEIDTGDAFFYDESTSAWIKQGGGE